MATTKKEESKTAKSSPTQYVALQRISWKSQSVTENRHIEPYVDENGKPDPFNPEAERFDLEHLSEEEVKLLVLRKAVAEDK